MAEAKVEIQKEMVYTVPLKYAWLGPHNDRTRKAVDVLKRFVMRHMKVKEVKIAAELNEKIWERGIKNPPRRIKVRVAKVSDEVAWVTLPEHKFPFELEAMKKKEEEVVEKKESEEKGKAGKVEEEKVKKEEKDTTSTKAEKTEEKAKKTKKEEPESKQESKKEEKSTKSSKKGGKATSPKKEK